MYLKFMCLSWCKQWFQETEKWVWSGLQWCNIKFKFCKNFSSSSLEETCRDMNELLSICSYYARHATNTTKWLKRPLKLRQRWSDVSNPRIMIQSDKRRYMRYLITFAASEYWPFWKRRLNFRTNKSSAPAKLFLTAMRRARSGFCKTLLIYGMMLSSSTLTDKTCPFRLTPIIPPDDSCGAVTKMVSPLIRFI